jgi:hypothetical protein
MALWAWSFVGGGETDYLLFIVTAFIVVVVALQLVLMRVRRVDQTADADSGEDGTLSFHEWARGEFEAERGRLRAAEAALLILLPIAAAATGMMAFGIEFQIVERGL